MKQSEFQVRQASISDVARMSELEQELLREWNSIASAADARGVYEHILKNPSLGVIMVAEHEGAFCGFAYASYEWRAEYGGATMDLVEMIVEPAFRKQGVGKRLLNGLIDHARGLKIRRFTCQVHPGNSAIESALDSCGFDPERRTLWGVLL